MQGGAKRVLWRTVRERNIWLKDVAAAAEAGSLSLMAYSASALVDRYGYQLGRQAAEHFNISDKPGC